MKGAGRLLCVPGCLPPFAVNAAETSTRALLASRRRGPCALCPCWNHRDPFGMSHWHSGAMLDTGFPKLPGPFCSQAPEQICSSPLQAEYCGLSSAHCLSVAASSRLPASQALQCLRFKNSRVIASSSQSVLYTLLLLSAPRTLVLDRPSPALLSCRPPGPLSSGAAVIAVTVEALAGEDGRRAGREGERTG